MDRWFLVFLPPSNFSLPQGNRLLLNVSVRYQGRLVRGKFLLVGLGWKEKNQRTYYAYTTTAW